MIFVPFGAGIVVLSALLIYDAIWPISLLDDREPTNVHTENDEHTSERPRPATRS